MKKIEQKPVLDVEIPFGANDSELIEETYFIPEGFHAEIIDNEVHIKRGEQKPTWSEDDEVFFDSALWHIQNSITNGAFRSFVEGPLSTWLKSLKDRVQHQPQSNWKLSEKQIKAIRLARSFVTDDFDEHPALSEILIELENQLKKL